MRKGSSELVELLFFSGLWNGYAKGILTGVGAHRYQELTFRAENIVNAAYALHICELATVNVGLIMDYDRLNGGGAAVIPTISLTARSGSSR